ncbi:hypothetical protein [Spirosoma radiotolerans]|uniref:Glycosyl transferase n=1 Tax=Spirosoma radiotolerans TaxID=1379870 RepID=A0A0E3ZV83_9BACT|nr:hypothetical protein [Spirosoma radiotolerans]AKD54975.1 hypothetical protein SD10_08720 [Spirosoma radiotolerans]
MLLTICTIRQLPQALALGDSFSHHTTRAIDKPLVLIGLADDPAHLPAGFVSPYPLLPVREVLTPTALQSLSAKYTPTEFAAACKPLFIAEAFRRFPQEDKLLYADPSIQFLAPLSSIWEQLVTSTALITPFITKSPGDSCWPDEMFFQNVGLYSADFLAFRRSAETDRLLAWWDDRVRERAFIDFCAGLCLDQLWLMHVPVFFRDVHVIRNPGWHVALWNLPERTIQQADSIWKVSGPAGSHQPLQFINFKGLENPDEGFFPYQNRLQLTQQPAIDSLVTSYRQQLKAHQALAIDTIKPAYGNQPEPVVLRGWRHTARESLQRLTRFIDRVHIPVIN